MQVTSYNSTSQHKFLFKLENSEEELSMSVKEHMLLTISRKIIASSKQTIIKTIFGSQQDPSHFY